VSYLSVKDVVNSLTECYAVSFALSFHCRSVLNGKVCVSASLGVCFVQI